MWPPKYLNLGPQIPPLPKKFGPKKRFKPPDVVTN